MVVVGHLLLPLPIMENVSFHRKIGMFHGTWHRNHLITSNVVIKIEPSNESGNYMIIIVLILVINTRRIEEIRVLLLVRTTITTMGLTLVAGTITITAIATHHIATATKVVAEEIVVIVLDPFIDPEKVAKESLPSSTVTNINNNNNNNNVDLRVILVVVGVVIIVTTEVVVHPEEYVDRPSSWDLTLEH
jgi:hypothetical protein